MFQRGRNRTSRNHLLNHHPQFPHVIHQKRPFIHTNGRFLLYTPRKPPQPPPNFTTIAHLCYYYEMDSTTTLDTTTQAAQPPAPAQASAQPPAPTNAHLYYIETASNMQRQRWLKTFKTTRLPVKAKARWIGISKNGVEKMTYIYDLDPTRLEPEQRARALAIFTKDMSITKKREFSLNDLKIDAKTCRLCTGTAGQSFA